MGRRTADAESSAFISCCLDRPRDTVGRTELDGDGRGSKFTAAAALVNLAARAWVLGLLVVGLLCVTGAPAMAATATTAYTWQDMNQSDDSGSAYFGSSGGGAQGLAVEPGTGNIAIAGAGVVEIYSPARALLTSISTGGAPNGLAFDQTSGALYVSDATSNTITRYTSDGAPAPTFTADAGFVSPAQGSAAGQIGSFASRIAVDPTSHDLLVADSGNQRVSRYSSTGAFVRSIDGSTTTGGAFTELHDVAVGPGGVTYVVDCAVAVPLTSAPCGSPSSITVPGSAPVASRVEQFSAAGVSQGTLPVAGAPVNVTVDTVTGEVSVQTTGPDFAFTPDGSLACGDIWYAVHFEGFGAGGLPTYPATRWPNWTSCESHGALAIDVTTKKLYGQTSSSGTLPFVRQTIPAVDTPIISDVQPTSIRVSTDFDFGPGPPAGSSVHFEYSIDGSSTWISTPDLRPSSSPAEADITGLDAEVSYHVRAVVVNNQQTRTSSVSDVTTPQGPPSAITGNATDVDADSAVIYGSINPFGHATTYHFEYGKTVDYGNRAPAGGELSAGTSRTQHTYHRNIGGLEPNTTYHYRIVAQSDLGVGYGADETFQTTAPGPADVRGYEQVTPVDKDGGIVHVSFGTSSSPDGSALAFATAGAPLGSNALLRPPTSVPVLPEYATWRGPQGWGKPASLDAPISLLRAFIWVTTIGISDDTVHAFVATNHKLAEGATEGQLNLYVTDVRTGTYIYVGGSSAPDALLNFVGQYRDFNKFDTGAADYRWIIFNSIAPLLPGVTGTATYRWSREDGLQLASVMPDGSPPVGNIYLRSAGQPNFKKASDDGSVLYFAVEGDGVYVRKNGQTKAVSLSHVAGEDPAVPHPGFIYGTSRDGRYVVFGDQGGTRLTTDAPNGKYGNVYRYDNSSGDLRFVGPLNFVGPVDAQNNASFVPYVSEDGDTVVFYSDAALDPEYPGSGVYIWHHGTIHSLTHGVAGGEGSQGSPNGRYYAMGRPGPDDTQQVYIFDTQTETLACASCPPGAKGLPDGAILPRYDPAYVGRKPRAVTDSGQVFFTTSSKLVAADTNGRRDVYVYQNGKTTLISPGNKEFDARLVEISEDGSDVFFTTSQSLVGQDTDRGIDIYDARVGGGFAEAVPPSASCVGVGCAEPGSGPASSPGGGSEALPGVRKKSRSNQSKVTVKVSKVTFTSVAMHVSVRASGAGRVRVSGARVSTTVRQLSKAGTYTVVVRLNKRARALRRAHRRFKVTAKVSLTPAWGAASTARVSKTVGR